MLENVGISSQKVINDMVTGQQCVVEAAIKETLSAIPGANGADIKVFIINKISEGNTILFKITENYPFLINNDIGKDFVFFPANSS